MLPARPHRQHRPVPHRGALGPLQRRRPCRRVDLRAASTPAIRAELDGLPAFETFSLGSPFRRYVLLRGPVEAATQLPDPGEPGSFRRPDLWWPDDRRWFVATDTDFWSLYVGGDEAMIDELAASVPTVVERCVTDTFVNAED